MRKIIPLENEDEKSDKSFTQKEEDLFQDFIFDKKATNGYSTFLLRYLGYNCFRILMLIIFIILLLVLIVFIVLFYSLDNYFESFLCFELKNKARTPFLSDLNSFLLCLIIIIINIISIIHFMFKNNKIKIHPYLNEMSFGLPLTLIFLLIRLLLGAFVHSQIWLYIVHLLLSLLSIALILVLYVNKKNKKYNRAVSIINESFFPSLLLGLYTYEVLYLIYKLIQKESFNNLNIYLAIGFNIAFFCIALCLLTLFKDIIFTLFLGIIEMGLLTQSKANDILETITAIFILLFLFGSSVILIFKYKTKVFGYFEEDNTKCIIYDADKMRMTI